MGRPKGSKNKVKRGPGRPAAARRGRPPMAKRGRPAGRPKTAVRRNAATYNVMLPRAQQAGLNFNPVDWMPLVMAAVDLIKMIREIIAKENGVALTPVASASPRTSESVAKTVAAKAESNAVPVAGDTVKKRGRPKKDVSMVSAKEPVSASAETQEEMELEDPLDDGSDEFGDELEEDPLDDDTLGEDESVDSVL